jgi:hypothetical protein
MRPAHDQKEKAVGVERTHGVKSVLKKTSNDPMHYRRERPKIDCRAPVSPPVRITADYSRESEPCQSGRVPSANQGGRSRVWTIVLIICLFMPETIFNSDYLSFMTNNLLNYMICAYWLGLPCAVAVMCKSTLRRSDWCSGYTLCVTACAVWRKWRASMHGVVCVAFMIWALGAACSASCLLCIVVLERRAAATNQRSLKYGE